MKEELGGFLFAGLVCGLVAYTSYLVTSKVTDDNWKQLIARHGCAKFVANPTNGSVEFIWLTIEVTR